MPAPRPVDKHKYAAVIYLVIALIGSVWLRDTWVMLRETEAVPYSEVQRLLREGLVKSVKITGNTIRAELRAPCLTDTRGS